MQIEDFIVSPKLSIVEVMKCIDRNAQGIVYVCDDDRRLLGVITDGDVRRAIIHTGKLDAQAQEVMKTDPITLMEKERNLALVVMNEHLIRSVPILDGEGRLAEIRFLDEKVFTAGEKVEAPVVIMAGGKGVRLQPYTNILPKPLIPIGDKTITEHIMDRFIKSGCHHFDMVVNYKKHFIKAYFRDLESKPEVSFIEEEEFLGTAGGLRLLIGRYNEAFFMTNCDILIEEEYAKIMDYHKRNGNLATIVCAVKNTTLPYGVVETGADGRVSAIREKPDISSIVNTGFYVLEPEFLEKIPAQQVSQITDVFQMCIDEGLRIGMYPVSEDRWMDMGQMDELEKMRTKLYGE